MVTDRDERLPEEIARQSWVILLTLVALSFFWRTPSATLGVLGGGLVAILGYHWLHRSLRRLLSAPLPGSERSFKFGYFVRLASLAAALYLLIVPMGVHPAGLAVGLSVVVLSILWTTLKRSF